jgi:hypothetical protein
MIVAAVVFFTAAADAQLPPPLPPPPTLNFNPSSPLIVPQAPEVPVSPGLGSGGANFNAGTSAVPGDIISDEPKPYTQKPQPHHRHHHHQN